MLKFRFSRKVTITCSVLVVLMCWASWWQYTEWKEKTAYISQLDERMKLEPVPFESLWQGSWESLVHRRVILNGSWDFENEIILRNRKLKESAGVHIVTPLHVTSVTPPLNILVSRGFAPVEFSSAEERKEFRAKAPATFVGLIKEAQERRMFAPEDPVPGEDAARVDAWLRIQPALIQKQIPYQLENIVVEVFPDNQSPDSESMLNKKSDRDNMLYMPSAGSQLGSYTANNKSDYPVQQVDFIVPPGRHYSYIFEWLILALFTTIGGLILQLKRF